MITREYRYYGPSWPNEKSFRQECSQFSNMSQMIKTTHRLIIAHGDHRVVTNNKPDFTNVTHEVGPKGTRLVNRQRNAAANVIIAYEKAQWEELREAAFRAIGEPYHDFAESMADALEENFYLDVMDAFFSMGREDTYVPFRRASPPRVSGQLMLNCPKAYTNAHRPRVNRHIKVQP